MLKGILVLMKCIDCGKPLGRIEFKKHGLTPTKEVRCNECGLKGIGL